MKLLTKYKWLILIILLTIGGLIIFQSKPETIKTLVSNNPSEESFQAPGRDWPSEKKVEDYFVEHLRMSPEEARQARDRSADGTVMLRIRDTAMLEGLLSNLEYYGLVRDKEALRYALVNTEDTVPGHANPIEVGDNTIDTWAYYRISEDMSAWEIANILLNKPNYFAYDEYNYMFMP